MLLRLFNRLKRSFVIPFYHNRAVKFLLYAYYKIIARYFPAVVFLFDSTMMIALNYNCQCKCAHCYASYRKDDSKQELTREEIIRVIDEAVSMGVSEIHFLGGEPLLAGHIFDIISYAREKGMITRIDTNGFLLNEENVSRLKKSGIDFVGVSIDSASGDIHDGLRGVNGLFEKAVQGISHCRDRNIEAYISTYAVKKSLQDGSLDRLIALAGELGVCLRVLSPIRSGRFTQRDDVMLGEKEMKLLRQKLKHNKVFWEIKYIDDENIPFLCSAFKRMWFYVSAYGDVQPCCFMPVPFGNVRQEPLPAILKRMWDSEMIKKRKEWNECPLNDKKFREEYAHLFKGA
ncbi:MAG: radical SAM protein [Candidatus Omnitrophica bacterium]|nr:radical SAM protein [Candidatus Omnitrophota bacterium]